MPAPAPARPPLPLRRRLLFAAIPLLVLLFVGELAVRAVRAPLHFGSFRDLRTDLLKRNYPAAKDPQLGYVPKAGFASRDNHWGTLVSIDADGLRRNGPNPPPSGERVIVCVGDSFTFGDEVDDDASWPAQLEQTVAKPVKNGGVFGYSFAQAALRAEQLIARFPTSDVVLAFIPDDLTRCEYERRYTPNPWFDLEGDGLVLRGVPIDHDAPHPDPSKPWKDALGHSALLDAILANTARRWWFENEKQVPVPHLVGKGGEIGKRLVVRLAAACRERGARLLVVQLGETPRDDGSAVLAHATAHGVATLDLIAAYQQRLAQDASLRTRWFRGHMTREGNAWAAQQIAAALAAPVRPAAPK